ncbi:hypothetical protein [Dyella sp. A6]|uniref:hypothetical protein n=1 Tax=Dyella aluminiiresistens TaxID=3069105 RepID=UPI002E79B9DF|nr:hypothetical protein [Dyella sp. A6]
MDALVVAAQFVTCIAIGEAEGAYAATSEEEKDRLIAVAAAKANYLFAREPDDSHLAKLNLREIDGEAEMWLSKQKKLQELVVQSLRVQNMVSYGRTGHAPEPPLGSKILAKYGSHYPDAPNPDSYPILVRQSLDELSQTNREDLLESFEHRGIQI